MPASSSAWRWLSTQAGNRSAGVTENVVRQLRQSHVLPISQAMILAHTDQQRLTAEHFAGRVVGFGWKATGDSDVDVANRQGVNQPGIHIRFVTTVTWVPAL